MELESFDLNVLCACTSTAHLVPIDDPLVGLLLPALLTRRTCSCLQSEEPLMVQGLQEFGLGTTSLSCHIIGKSITGFFSVSDSANSFLASDFTVIFLMEKPLSGCSQLPL